MTISKGLCCNYTNGGGKPSVMTEILILLQINLVKQIPFIILNRILLDNIPLKA